MGIGVASQPQSSASSTVKKQGTLERQGKQCGGTPTWEVANTSIHKAPGSIGGAAKKKEVKT